MEVPHDCCNVPVSTFTVTGHRFVVIVYRDQLIKGLRPVTLDLAMLQIITLIPQDDDDDDNNILIQWPP